MESDTESDDSTQPQTLAEKQKIKRGRSSHRKSSGIEHAVDEMNPAGKDFMCKKCRSFFETKSSLMSHVDQEHPRSKKYTCKVCRKRYKDRSRCEKHIEEVHLKDGTKQFREKMKERRRLKKRLKMLKKLNSEGSGAIDPRTEASNIEAAIRKLKEDKLRKKLVRRISKRNELEFASKPEIELKTENSIESSAETDDSHHSRESIDLPSSDMIDHFLKLKKLSEKIKLLDEIKEEDDLSSKSSTADDLSFSSNPSTSDMPSTSTSVCGFCGKSFLYKRNLDRHIRRKHKSIKSQSRRKTVASTDNLRTRVAEVDGAFGVPSKRDKFSCEICGAPFDAKADMSTHIETQHQVDSQVFNDVWNSKLAEKAIRRQEKVKNKSKTFSCNFCSKSYARSDYLKKHVKLVHLGIVDIFCSECGKAFMLAKDLREHMAKHSDRKLEVKFQTSKQSDEKTLYHCSVCGKVFMSKWSLIRHFRNVHSDDKKVLKVKKEDVEVKEEISEEPC